MIHFKRKEFACKCGCGFDVMDIELINLLEILRAHFDQPISVHSGCRCKKHNKLSGGSKKSQHLFGKAADITIKNTTPRQVQDYIDKIYEGGMGRYKTFTHVDVRAEKVRWTG